jgi:hypothetical protein
LRLLFLYVGQNAILSYVAGEENSIRQTANQLLFSWENTKKSRPLSWNDFPFISQAIPYPLKMCN